MNNNRRFMEMRTTDKKKQTVILYTYIYSHIKNLNKISLTTIKFAYILHLQPSKNKNY